MSHVKAAGWQRIVAELSAPAPDDRVFMVRLTVSLAQVCGARQAVLHAVAPVARDADEGPRDPEPRRVFVWPTGAPGSASGAAPEVEHEPDVTAAARAAAAGREVRVFGLGKGDQMYDGSPGAGYLLAVPVAAPAIGAGESGVAPSRYVVTLLLDQRSRQAVQTTLAMAEVLAGYVHAHAARQEAARLRSAGAALELATRLLAAVNAAPTFRGCMMQLANDLARAVKADRVAIGWVKGAGESGRTHAVAVSDTEQIDRRMAMIQKIEAAMDECLDQEQPVLFPPPPPSGDPEADVLLAQAMVQAHRELAAGEASMRCASLPLRVDGRVVGVATVEASARPRDDGATVTIHTGTVEMLQAALDLIAPVLEVRRSDDRWLSARAWAWSVRTAAWAVGPRQTVWKAAGVLLLAGLVAAAVVRVPYRVGSPATLQPVTKRTISAPFTGVIRALGEGIRPGAEVKAGQLLLELDTSEIRLQELEQRALIAQHEKEADAALRENKLAEAQQAQARADQARAARDRLALYLEQSRITAPLDGTIIAGDARDKVGSRVELGQAIFELAPLDEMHVIARVPDRDIALVEPGMRGYLVTKARPGERFACVVEQIVPLAQAEGGTNAFEVRAALQERARWLRPGMEGIAKLELPQEKSLLWIASRRIVDTLRLWLWW